LPDNDVYLIAKKSTIFFMRYLEKKIRTKCYIYPRKKLPFFSQKNPDFSREDKRHQLNPPPPELPSGKRM